MYPLLRSTLSSRSTCVAYILSKRIQYDVITALTNYHGKFKHTVTPSEPIRTASSSDDDLRKINENSPLEMRLALRTLERHSPDSTKLYQALLLASKGFKNRKHFYVPREDSDSPFTLMVSKDEETDGPVANVALFTTTDRLKELYDFLTRTNVLNFNEGIIFCAVPVPLCDTIQQACEARGGVFRCTGSYSLMTLSPKLATQLVINVPEHVYLAPLRLEHASTVHNNWRYRSLEKVEVIEQQIANLQSVGVYLRETGELVSWIMLTNRGSMGLLYTKRAHRRFGFGELTVLALSKQLAMIGLAPFCFADDYNTTAFNMFCKIGFEKLQAVKLLSYAPQHLAKTVEFLAESVHIPQDESTR